MAEKVSKMPVGTSQLRVWTGVQVFKALDKIDPKAAEYFASNAATGYRKDVDKVSALAVKKDESGYVKGINALAKKVEADYEKSD